MTVARVTYEVKPNSNKQHWAIAGCLNTCTVEELMALQKCYKAIHTEVNECSPQTISFWSQFYDIPIG